MRCVSLSARMNITQPTLALGSQVDLPEGGFYIRNVLNKHRKLDLFLL